MPSSPQGSSEAWQSSSGPGHLWHVGQHHLPPCQWWECNQPPTHKERWHPGLLPQLLPLSYTTKAPHGSENVMALTATAPRALGFLSASSRRAATINTANTPLLPNCQICGELHRPDDSKVDHQWPSVYTYVSIGGHHQGPPWSLKAYFLSLPCIDDTLLDCAVRAVYDLFQLPTTTAMQIRLWLCNCSNDLLRTCMAKCMMLVKQISCPKDLGEKNYEGGRFSKQSLSPYKYLTKSASCSQHAWHSIYDLSLLKINLIFDVECGLLGFFFSLHCFLGNGAKQIGLKQWNGHLTCGRLDGQAPSHN